jgi:uncharacterized cupredoxin-like copper-binding protein
LKRKIETLFLLTLFIIGYAMVNTTHKVAAHEHEEHEGAANECHDPTETLMISTAASGLVFDKTELKATKGACIMVMFMNTQDVPHDFTMNRANGSEWTHLHLDNSLDNNTGTPGQNMVHLQMPDEDLTLDFWCSVNGHRGAGMEGKFVIGEGSPEDDEGFLPGFGVLTALMGLFTLLIAIPKLRNRV